MMSRAEDLNRIESALEQTRTILADFTPGDVEHRVKSGDDPLTEADTRIDAALHEILPREGEGWLSEETKDDAVRLKRERVWVVDPIDGTREFVAGIPEWCVSIGLVEHGRAVAGGILIPPRNLVIVGSVEDGVTLRSRSCRWARWRPRWRWLPPGWRTRPGPWCPSTSGTWPRERR
jgi:myo-inositol-1(or 4)-monophosphatase